MPTPTPHDAPSLSVVGVDHRRSDTAAHAACLYNELRALAASYFGKDQGATLTPTALVHEAFAKLVGSTVSTDWESRAHFFAVAAKAMRQILIDRARAKATEKRCPAGERVSLETVDTARGSTSVDVIDLDEALDELARTDARAARLVELRFFAGLSVPEAAEVLGIGMTAAEDDWRFARAWLMKRLKDYGPSHE